MNEGEVILLIGLICVGAVLAAGIFEAFIADRIADRVWRKK